MGTNRLGTVSRLLRQWRVKHGSGAGYAIPKHLRQKAVELLDEHSIETVARELELGACTVSRWRKVQGPKKRKAPGKSFKEPEFVEVNRVAASTFDSMTLEWVRPDGSQMRLTGCRGQELRGLINEFLAAGAR